MNKSIIIGKKKKKINALHFGEILPDYFYFNAYIFMQLNVWLLSINAVDFGNK